MALTKNILAKKSKGLHHLGLGGHLSLGRRAVAETARVSPGYFTISVTLNFIVASLPALQVYAVRILTNEMVNRPPRATVLIIVVAVAACVGLQACAMNASWLFSRIINTRYVAWLQTQTNRSIALMTPAEIANPALAQKCLQTRETFKEGGFYTRNILTAIQGAVALLGLFISLWPVSPLSAALLISSLLIVLPFLNQASKLETNNFPKIVEHQRFAGYYADQITYQRTASELISLGSASHVADMADKRYKKAAFATTDMYMRVAGWQILSGIFATILTGLALWFASSRSDAGAGGAAAAIVAVLSSAMQASDTAEAIGTFMSTSGLMRDAYQFLDSRKHRKSPSIVPTDVNSLASHRASYRYPGSDIDALSEANISVRKGEIIALVGLNGSGKTTMVNCLAGLYDLTRGTVFLDNRPINSYTDNERLSAISLLAQEFGHYEFTVRDTVSLGSPSGTASDEAIWAALKIAKADVFVQKLPYGLDTQLGQQWGGTGLSGGQWQRLALARIVLRNAPIWILDEPTSAVDAITEEEIFSNLAATKAERITIIVSHRAWTLRNVDRIYILADGQIVESGAYSDLIKKNGVFTEMFKFQTTTSQQHS